MIKLLQTVTIEQLHALSIPKERHEELLAGTWDYRQCEEDPEILIIRADDNDIIDGFYVTRNMVEFVDE